MTKKRKLYKVRKYYEYLSEVKVMAISKDDAFDKIKNREKDFDKRKLIGFVWSVTLDKDWMRDR